MQTQMLGDRATNHMAGGTAPRRRDDMPSPAQGFTIIEVLMVVVISAIILSLGVPAFIDTVRNNRITAGVNDMVSAIQLTRSEASKRGTAVTLCPSSNSMDNSPSCGNVDWEDGYIAFVDENGNGALDAGTDELVLAQNSMHTKIFVRASSAIGSGITYGGDGFPAGLTGSLAMVFCDSSEDSLYRVLDISATGRPLVRRGASAPAGLFCSG